MCLQAAEPRWRAVDDLGDAGQGGPGRASACDYDGTVAHDGQLDEETVAEQVRLADIGRKLLLATGRELGDLLEVPHSRCCSSWSWLNRGRCSSVRRWHPCSAPNPVGIRTFREG